MATINLLLVEDDEIDVKAIKRAFKELKIANPMRVARDGLEALDILRGTNGQEPLARPYMILLDLNMPRMDGLEFLQELRADPALRQAIVFVLTTSRAEEDRMRAYEKNVAGYMVKSAAGRSFLDALAMLDHYWRVVEMPEEPA